MSIIIPATDPKPIPVAQPRRRQRKDSVDNPYLNMLLYSEYGVGKTKLASTADDVEDMRDVLYANVDWGDEVIPRSSNIDILDFTGYNEFNDLYHFLQLHCKYRDSNDIEKLRKLESDYMRVPVKDIEVPRKYKTVIFDTVTEMQKLLMYQQLGIDILKTKVGEAFPKPSFEEWAQVLEQLLLHIRKYRNLPIHSIFLGQLDEDVDDKRKKFYLPLLQGQAQKLIHGFFDCVGFYAMRVEGEGTANPIMRRRLYVSPVGPFKAKNRFANFPGYCIDDPTMKDILDARNGVYNKK